MGMRYGLKLYGSDTYGAPTNTNKIWVIQVDWDEDGAYGSGNEAFYCVDMSVRRGRQFFLGSEGQGYQPFGVGTCTLSFINTNGRFDAFNTSSPLSPDVEPGKFITAYFLDGLGGTQYDVFTGTIEDIEPYRQNGLEHVRVYCKDGWQWLKDEEANIDVETNIATGTAIGMILDDIGWPTLWGRSLDTGDLTVPYWWVSGKAASVAIQELVDAEGGRFYIAADGTATFESRNASSAEVVAITESQAGKEVSMPQPWDVVRNRYEVVVHPTVERTSVTLWELGGTISLGAGESRTLFANLQYDNRPVVATGTPSSSLTANTAADGTGTDLSSDFTITIDAVFGEIVKLTVENTSASSGHLTSATLTGDGVDIPYTYKLVQDDSGTDQPRVFTLESRNIQAPAEAETQLTFLATLLASIREFPYLRLEDRLEQQFSPDLTNNVRLDIPTKGVDNTSYRLGWVEHNWLHQSGQAIESIMRFEPFVEIDQFTLDVDSLDGTEVLG